MDNPASFATLPYELVAKIMKDPGLKKKDVGSLRLTCKHAYPLATELLVKKKSFTELPVMMSEYSLRTFVDICKKAVLGQLVRKVRFSSLRINPASLSAYAGDSLLFKGREHPESATERCEDVKACLSRYCDELALKPSDKVVKLLKLGFRHLARYGNPIQISVSDVEYGSIGLSGSFSDWDGDAVKLWSNEYQDALRILISAASGSACEIQGLELEVKSHRGSESTFPDNFKTRLELQPFWNNLESVRFFFLTGKPSRTCVREMGEIVSQANRLKYLHYSEDNGRMSFNAIAKSIKTQSLKELHLQHFCTVEASLIKVLEQNCNSITKLTIADCELNKGSWEPVLIYVKDKLPSLNSLELDDLSHSQSNMMAYGNLLYEGRDAIQSGLRALLP